MIIRRESWPRPALPPEPGAVRGVAAPVIDLSGHWLFNWEPPEQYWLPATDTSAWQSMPVPCDVSATRAEPASREYAYRQMIGIPADFAGQKILLRFEGANYQTRVWVDGHPAGEHCGGFTTWDCDITRLVTAGQTAVLTVGIQDRPHHLNPDNKGGLIRPVKLLALPPVHISRLHPTTVADAACENYHLNLNTAIVSDCDLRLTQWRIDYTLAAPDGTVLQLQASRPASQIADFDVTWPIRAPRQWDAEHPNLYTLEAKLFVNDIFAENVIRQVGFRQITISGSQMLINGRPVKLRGICRQDISPMGGRTVSAALAEQDLRLLKQANVNYIRTTNYPPTAEFLDLCDRYGFYVQEESPLAFIDNRLPAVQNDPQYTDEIMRQCAEMIERDKSHPCVIIWGLGSESAWGINFRLQKEYVRREDPTRPLVFNYPMSYDGESEPPEIWSVHYLAHDLDPARQYDHMIIGHTHGSDQAPGYELGFARGSDRPVLHDEYAHIACYNRDEHKRDPGIRDFWGESIRRLWDRIWNTPGALGGAIWSAIDDVTIYSGGANCAEWGILDVWRRPKPEYFHVRQAYAPVRIQEEAITADPAGCPDEQVTVTIENRYNHTDLNELDIAWAVESSGSSPSGSIRDFSLQPGCLGRLTLPVRYRDLAGCGSLILRFTERSGLVAQNCRIPVNPPAVVLPVSVGLAPVILEKDATIFIQGQDFDLAFSRSNGKIIAGRRRGQLLLQGGPELHLEGIRLPDWQLDSLTTETRNHEAVITCRGHYGELAAVTFTVGIDGQGLISTDYRLDRLNAVMPRTVKIRVGLDCGGLDEIGVSFMLDKSCDRLTWRRQALWNAYPDDHIGRPAGTACRYPARPDQSSGSPPGRIPTGPWSVDDRDPALYGPYDQGLRGTHDFRSMKHRIIRAAVYSNSDESAVTVESCGCDAVRLEVAPDAATVVDDRDTSIRYVGTWYQMDDPSGSHANTEMFSETAGDYAEIDFTGTGIQWYGPADMIGGIARVFVDGRMMAGAVSQYADDIEKPGMSRGYEKRYQKLLFAVDGLTYDKHTLKIEVTGQKQTAADYAFVMIDWFRVLGHGPDPVRLIICNDWNYTRLAWGNYVRPAIRVGSGYRNQVRLRLGAAPDSSERRIGS